MRQANRTLRSTSLQNPDRIEQAIFRLTASDPTAEVMPLIGADVSQLQFPGALGRFEASFWMNRGDVRPLVFPEESDTSGGAGRPANYEPVEAAWYIPGPTGLIDTYTATTSTTGTLVVDAANHVVAACDTPGDNDWFAVTLTAGVTYQFGQYAYAGGIPGVEGNGTPLADAYLEIYDENGLLLSIADGGGPNTPSGLDALMTFQATYTGTYYVNATSYDNTGDGIGDFAGDYEIFAITATGPSYTTHYDISSPLHSIDWGGVLVNREHVSVRNPDGEEGPRTTGEPAADPGDVVGNSLGFPGKNVIYLYFGGEGDLYANADSTIPAQVTVQNPYQYEIQAMLTAANEFSKVADVVFVSNYTFNASTGLYERNENIEYKPGPLGPEAGVQYATGVDGDGFDADFFYFSYPGTPGPGISLLGSMSPPDYGDEGVAQFNSADERWNAQMLQQGGFSFVTLIHEFGHGMGLAHPHDTGGGSSVMPGVDPLLPGDDGGAGTHGLNQGVYTMMSYNDGWESSPYGSAETNNEGYGWLGSLMALDIAVIQDKYGVNEEWATGNDTYVLKDVNEWGVYIDAATGEPAEHDATNQATARDGYYEGQSTFYSSIWDAGGIDQIVYSGARNTNIDLRAATLQYETGGGGWMSFATGIFGGFTIANGVTIENAISGNGNDTLTGNDVDNMLIGGGGTDILTGLDGNDLYRVEQTADQVIEAIGGGADAVYAVTSFALAAGSEVELLSAIDPNNAVAMDLTGNEFANFVIGNNGVNTLIGGGGPDTLIGNGGNDIYRVEDSDDKVVELAGGGTDSVYAVGSYTLAAGASVELLSAIDPANSVAMTLIGNEFDNFVIGNAGVNTLIGGAGSDTLIGNGGNDFYRVEDSDDKVTEAVGGGIDSVYAVGSYTLAAGAEVELLSAIDPANSVAMTLTGNEFDNFIIGNAGSNTLIGGAGSDTLIGNGGDDFYRVEDTGDKITEGAGGGMDSAFAVGSYTLTAGAEVEILSAIDPAATTAMTLTGNEFANTIIGNAGVNILIGGAGNDVLSGRAGNDFYRVEQAGDVVLESGGGGTDAVYAAVSYTLGAGQEIEMLSAIDPASGGAMNLTGNEFANTVIGSAGANNLNGGAGADALHGNGGADNFTFTTALGGGNIDAILDFSVVAGDKVVLDDAVFTGLGLGALSADAFVSGPAALDGNDRIIYDRTTGALSFDADGSGAGAAVQFATVHNAPVLSASDFMVI